MNGYVGKRELKWVCVEDDENPSCRGYIQQCMKVFLKSTSSSSEYEVSSSHPHKTFSVLTGLPSNSFWPVDCLLNLQTTKAVANKRVALCKLIVVHFVLLYNSLTVEKFSWCLPGAFSPTVYSLFLWEDAL